MSHCDEFMVIEEGESGLLVVEEGGEAFVVIDEGDELYLTTEGEAGPPGAQGATGPMGPSGAGSVVQPFAYGDATPVLLTTIAAGKRVFRAHLTIDQAFDGLGASLSVGPLASPGELLASGDNAPASVATYETTPGLSYGVSTGIYLFITPGSGASSGTGAVILDLEP